MLVRPTKSAAGFTMAELLIALMVTGILLVAMAVAFNASLANYRVNEDILGSINKARQALLRITTQVRTANAVAPGSPNNECTLITAAGDDITYRYSSEENKLYLITNDDSSDSDYVLCDNITAMTFVKTLTINGADVKSVQISITVASGNIEKTVAAAAVVRRILD
ncbi:MAG: prepilin-type N-terminal cleavage/methylation domain-containing protein [Phycisphaerae bacterium]|nr:prepilin-type N-terminal cleavage/methylation domain-containing protein [Phycisphaerae bacterium]